MRAAFTINLVNQPSRRRTLSSGNLLDRHPTVFECSNARWASGCRIG
jgi:hypothetical protein